MNKRIIGGIIVAAIVTVVIFAGCIEEETPTPTPTPTSLVTVVQPDGYETITVVWESGSKSNLYKITGEGYYFPYGTHLFKAETYYERTIYTDEDMRLVWLDLPNRTYYFLPGAGVATVDHVHRLYGDRKPTQSLSSYGKSAYDPFNPLVELTMRNTTTGVVTKRYSESQWPHSQTYVIPYGAKIWQKKIDKDEYYEWGTVVGLWSHSYSKTIDYIVITWHGEVYVYFSGLAAGNTYSSEKLIECAPQAVVENPEIAGYPKDMVFSGDLFRDEEGKTRNMKEHIEQVVREKYMIEK